MFKWLSPFGRNVNIDETLVELDESLDKMLDVEQRMVCAKPTVNELAERIERLKKDVSEPIEGKKERLASAHRVWSEPSFLLVLNELVENQIQHSIRMADSWDRVLFDRATINGLELVKNMFESLEEEFQAMIEPPEQFDKHDIL